MKMNLSIRKWVFILCLMMPSILFAQFATVQKYGEPEVSTWDSNFSKVTIYQQGPLIWGTYDYSGGKFVGSISNGCIYGYWFETDDKTGVGPGGAYCGPFVLVFSSDGRSFNGVYGKHERGESTWDKMDPARTWNGTLTSGSIKLKLPSGSEKNSK